MIIDNIILGAGIAGITYANEMLNRGENSIVFEAENYSGGLCHSYTVNNFTFDSAVHLSFTENSVVRKFFDRTPYNAYKPISYNYYKGYWVKHPLINNMYQLKVEDKVKFISSYVNRPSNNCNNYYEWLVSAYGAEIADEFYTKYTLKYWKVDPLDMGTDWLGDRLNAANLNKILKGAFSGDTGIDYYAKQMRYPREKGGFENFIKPMTKDIHFKFVTKAIAINTNLKKVEFEDGTVHEYGHIISSIPLPNLIAIMNDVPETVRNAALKLEATKVSLVSIGFCKPDIPQWLWFYIYDEDIMASRVNAPSLKSKANVPEGCSSLQFEIYHHPSDEIDKQEIIENVKYSLKKMNICQEEDILFMDYRVLPYANVIFTKDTVYNREIVRRFVKERGITLIGRFGEWEYFWSDQSMMSAIKAANRMGGGE